MNAGDRNTLRLNSPNHSHSIRIMSDESAIDHLYGIDGFERPCPIIQFIQIRKNLLFVGNGHIKALEAIAKDINHGGKVCAVDDDRQIDRIIPGRFKQGVVNIGRPGMIQMLPQHGIPLRAGAD